MLLTLVCVGEGVNISVLLMFTGHFLKYVIHQIEEVPFYFYVADFFVCLFSSCMVWNFIQRLSSPSMAYFLIIHDQEMIMLIFSFIQLILWIRVCFFFFFFEMLNQPYITGQTKLDHVLLYFYMLLDLFPNIFVIYVLEQLCWSTSEEKIHMYIFKLYNLGNFNIVNSVLFISNRDTHIFYFLNQLW